MNSSKMDKSKLKAHGSAGDLGSGALLAHTGFTLAACCFVAVTLVSFWPASKALHPKWDTREGLLNFGSAPRRSGLRIPVELDASYPYGGAGERRDARHVHVM